MAARTGTTRLLYHDCHSPRLFAARSTSAAFSCTSQECLQRRMVSVPALLLPLPPPTRVSSLLSRAAAAKERGQLAAVALNIAKPSPADRRSAAPKRPSSAEDAAAARRKQREARQPEERASDSRRARERAEVARVALGIGGRRGVPSPRRASQHDGVCDAKAQAPRRPSAVSPAGGADSVARGGRDDGRVFQRLQNLRVGSGGGSPAGGGAERAAQQPRRPDGEGRPGEGGRGARAAGVGVAGAAGSNSIRMEMDEALELARRRRAARAVFGPGFGARDDDVDDDQPGAQRVGVKDGRRSGLEAKSSGRSPDRSNSGAQGPTPDPSRRAAAKISAEAGARLPPPESRQATDHKQQQHHHHHHNRHDEQAAAPVDEKSNDGDRKQDMVPVEEEGAGGIDEDAHRRQGQGQARQHQESVLGIVPETIPPQAEQKESREDEGEKAGASSSAREEVAIDVGGDEEKEATRDLDGDSYSDFADGVDSDSDSDVAEGSGDGEVRSKIDLGVEDGWFQKFEAKMGAIKKQVHECVCCLHGSVQHSRPFYVPGDKNLLKQSRLKSAGGGSASCCPGLSRHWYLLHSVFFLMVI